MDFMQQQATSKGYTLDESQYHMLKDAIINMDVMPSMRALMSAGEALYRDNVAGFNCSYIAIDHPRAFDGMMYVLMCCTGVGFSVERQYIAKLPEVAEEFHSTDSIIRVPDSKVGWAKSFKQLVSLLYSGEVPQWDTSGVRPAGAKLRTFGGRASGPGPLEDLFEYTVALFKKAAGRKLTSYDCHSLCCKIADIVVVGGVRRSALIGLSNLSDDRIRRAKHGQWWEVDPHLRLANNSACYTEKPDFESFNGEWHDIYKSKSGERGIFSRSACSAKAALNGRRDADWEFGTNPCSEIILRPNQFCNLSEVIVRSTDNLGTLARKVECAAILGTLQATLTDFRYLRPVWKKNTEEEALLGVSLTGIMDHPVLSGKDLSTTWFDHPSMPDLPKTLEKLRDVAINTNKEWAERLGINQSTAITCVKPSGTVSQLTDTSSGIHPRYSKHYVRRVRSDVKDPITQFLVDQGVKYEVDRMNSNNFIFDFYQESPETSVIEGDMGSVPFLDLIQMYNEHWCEHKVSATVHYKDNEWLAIGQWVWDHFDKLSGVSFLPYDGHTYQQAPYEAICGEMYDGLKKEEAVIDWDSFVGYEEEDNTVGTQTLACTGGSCEI
jgi:ribonucleoside-diphosphate reductase alpha chain